MSYLGERFDRAALLMVRMGEVHGWMGIGPGLIPSHLASFKIDFSQPSVFLNLKLGAPFYIGPIAPMATHREFLKNPDVYKERTVIAYCTISYRSGKFVRKLRKRGIHVINLRGGLLAWLHAGGPVHRDGITVRKVHVYGKTWDLAPSSYETIY